MTLLCIALFCYSFLPSLANGTNGEATREEPHFNLRISHEVSVDQGTYETPLQYSYPAGMQHDGTSNPCSPEYLSLFLFLSMCVS